MLRTDPLVQKPSQPNPKNRDEAQERINSLKGEEREQAQKEFDAQYGDAEFTDNGFGPAYDQARQNPYYNTKAFDDNYRQYLQMIEKYRGNPELYQRLLQLYQYQQYTPGMWEGLFGDKSGYQDFYNQLHQQNMAAAQDLIDEYNQREYNDPQQQVAREKAAGINPELSGGQNISPGTAGDATPVREATPVTHPGGDAVSGTMQIFDFAKDVVTSVVGMYDLITGLGVKDAAIALSSLDVTDKAYDLALKQESGKIGPRRMFYKSPDGQYDWEKMATDFLDPSVTTAASKKGTRAERALRKARNSFYYDEKGQKVIQPALQNAIMSMDKEFSSNAVEYAKNRSEPGYDPQGIAEWAASLGQTQTKWRLDTMKFDSMVREFEYKIKKASLAGVQAESSYKSDLYGTTQDGVSLGTVEGQARMDTAKTQSLIKQGERIKAEYMKWLEDSRRSLYAKVYGSGKWYGKLGTLFLPGVLDSFDSVSTRFLDHIDNALDMLINPIGKAAGGAIGKQAASAISNAFK